MHISRIVRDAFEKWLSFTDYDIVDIVAATIVANRLEGEPMWLAIVGPSASGKTEIVRALEGLDRVHPLDRITPATFVSGFRLAGKPKKKPQQYGLLAKMSDGKPHIIVIEDFSLIFGKRRDTRGEVMADLRKLFDGRYVAPFGNDVYFEWRGKVGMIACSTGVYDREMGAQSKFGDRFLVVRSTTGNAEGVAERATRNAPNTKKMRDELAKAFQTLDELTLPKQSIELTLDVRTVIAKLSSFVARARTVVPRDTYRREVEAIPEVEGTGRMGSQLSQLLRGLTVYRERKEVTEEEIETVQKVAFGTIPSIRLKVMQQIETATPASSIEGVPQSVLQRTLEDLTMLELIEWKRTPGNPNNRGYYRPRDDWKAFFWHIRQKGDWAL